MEKLGLLCPVGGNVKWYHCYGKTVWQLLKKVKIELLYDPAILLLGIHPKELKAGSQRDICTPMVTAALFIIAKNWKHPKCPSTDE